MLCCGSQTLYYTVIDIDPYQTFFQIQHTPISNKLKHNQNKQIILPRTISLPILQNISIYSSQSQYLPQYQISFNQQTRQFIIKQIHQQIKDKLWKVLLQNQKQQLLQGDYFSFDGFQFEVYSLPVKISQPLSDIVSYLSDPDDRCRICFGDDTCDKNPLLNFCICSGSIKYMHLQCCRQWIKQGGDTIQGNNYVMHIYEKGECNICKQSWKKRIRHNKRQYLLYDFDPKVQQRVNVNNVNNVNNDNNNRGYIMFSMSTIDYDLSQQQMQQQQQKPYILIIKIQIPYKINNNSVNSNNNKKRQQQQDRQQKNRQQYNYSFKIGRLQQQCDIVLQQFIIDSEIQCQFIYNNNQLFIKDCNSINGTHILLHNHNHYHYHYNKNYKNYNNNNKNNKNNKNNYYFNNNNIRNKQNNNFILKNGLTLKLSNKIYQFKTKSHLFSFLQPQIQYNIKYIPYQSTNTKIIKQ